MKPPGRQSPNHSLLQAAPSNTARLLTKTELLAAVPFSNNHHHHSNNTTQEAIKSTMKITINHRVLCTGLTCISLLATSVSGTTGSSTLDNDPLTTFNVVSTIGKWMTTVDQQVEAFNDALLHTLGPFLGELPIDETELPLVEEVMPLRPPSIWNSIVQSIQTIFFTEFPSFTATIVPSSMTVWSPFQNATISLGRIFSTAKMNVYEGRAVWGTATTFLSQVVRIHMDVATTKVARGLQLFWQQLSTYPHDDDEQHTPYLSTMAPKLDHHNASHKKKESQHEQQQQPPPRDSLCTSSPSTKKGDEPFALYWAGRHGSLHNNKNDGNESSSMWNAMACDVVVSSSSLLDNLLSPTMSVPIVTKMTMANALVAPYGAGARTDPFDNGTNTSTNTNSTTRTKAGAAGTIELVAMDMAGRPRPVVDVRNVIS